MDAYYDAMKRRQHDDMLAAAKQAAESAGLWGGVTGAAAQLATGNRSIPSILLRGLGIGALAAPVAAGATIAGETLLGHPSAGETAPYARRSGLGGALGGTVLGGGLGYLLGSGRLRGLRHLPYASKIGAAAEATLPLNNIVTDYLRKWAREPSHGHGLKAATLLGLAGGAFGGMQGIDEGMSLDTMRGLQQNEVDQPYVQY